MACVGDWTVRFLGQRHKCYVGWGVGQENLGERKCHKRDAMKMGKLTQRKSSQVFMCARDQIKISESNLESNNGKSEKHHRKCSNNHSNVPTSLLRFLLNIYRS